MEERLPGGSDTIQTVFYPQPLGLTTDRDTVITKPRCKYVSRHPKSGGADD